MTDLIVTDLCKRYGEHIVFSHFSAQFPAETRTCIMGPSGCGKTTLLRIILGFESADSGTLTGRPDRISAVFQENRLFEGFSALSNVAAVCPNRDRAEIQDHLTELGLKNSLSSPVCTLSGGMKRRVAIARAVLAPGPLMILDEPFTGLDKVTKAFVLEYLKAHTKGRTVLLVTHDPAERDALAHQVLDMTHVDFGSK